MAIKHAKPAGKASLSQLRWAPVNGEGKGERLIRVRRSVQFAIYDILSMDTNETCYTISFKETQIKKNT